MKRNLALILALLMAVTLLAGCGASTAASADKYAASGDVPMAEAPMPAPEAGMMYDYECIQVNFGKNAADSDYILEHWDHQIDKTAANENTLNQYGFGVNDKGETLYCTWMPSNGTLVDTCAVIRDSEGQKTVYEAAIPWAILGSAEDPFAPEKGDEIMVSISVNCGSEDSKFKNILLRDGGGIIGINDWTKCPTITLD